MMIAIPEEEWTFFQTMGLDAFTRTLQQLAGNINLDKFKKHKRGPKKKMPKRTYDKKTSCFNIQAPHEMSHLEMAGSPALINQLSFSLSRRSFFT